jgi:4-hydroxybenzoate polyprenyltransferase
MKGRVLFLLKNSIHFSCIGLSAAAMTAETFLIFGQKIQLDLVAFIGLATLFGYNFWNHKMILRVLGWATGVGAAVLFFLKKWSFDPSILFVFLLILAYYFPKKNVAARSITFLKPLSIAAVWTICTVWLPEKLIFENPAHFYSLLYQRFFFVAALAIGFDLVDFSIDSAAGLRTIPVRFGKVFARNLAFIFLFLAFVFAFFNPDFPQKRIAALFLSLAVSGFLIQALMVEKMPNDAKIWIDSMMILQFFLVWVR